MVEYGTWNSSTGMAVKDKNVWKRRSNLKGYTFRFIRISTIKFLLAIYIGIMNLHQKKFRYTHEIMGSIYFIIFYVN